MTIPLPNGLAGPGGEWDDEPEPERYHCAGTDEQCEACEQGWCGINDGHCYPGSCNDPEDAAGCEHCGCCECTPCEYARVG